MNVPYYEERQVQVRCVRVIEGSGPSEKIAEVSTTRGIIEEVIVPNSFIQGNFLEVAKIAQDAASALVELPQESTSGNWRIWVPTDNLVTA